MTTPPEADKGDVMMQSSNCARDDDETGKQSVKLRYVHMNDRVYTVGGLRSSNALQWYAVRDTDQLGAAQADPPHQETSGDYNASIYQVGLERIASDQDNVDRAEGESPVGDETTAEFGTRERTDERTAAESGTEVSAKDVDVGTTNHSADSESDALGQSEHGDSCTTRHTSRHSDAAASEAASDEDNDSLNGDTIYKMAASSRPKSASPSRMRTRLSELMQSSLMAKGHEEQSTSGASR